MARTRNTLSRAAHVLRSGRNVDISSGSSSRSSKKKNKVRPRPAARKSASTSMDDEIFQFDEGEFDEGEFDQKEDSTDHERSSSNNSSSEDLDEIAESDDEEEESTDNYYPTKVAKLREAQKVIDGKGVMRQTPQGADKKANSKTSRNSKASAAALRSSKSAKVVCVACSNAHAKCVASDVPGEPCQRCEKMRLRCFVDPNHKRDYGRGMAKGKGIVTGGAEQEDSGDSSSEDSLNSPAPTARLASRNTTTRSSTPAMDKSTAATNARSSLTKPAHETQFFLSASSPLSSAPPSSDDELLSNMAGNSNKNKEKENNGEKNTDKEDDTLSWTPPSGLQPRLTTANQRMSSNDGVAAIVKHEQHTQSSPPARMDTPIPEQTTQPPDPRFSPGTSPAAPLNKDKGKGTAHNNININININKTSYDATPVDRVGSPGPASQFHYGPPNVVAPTQPQPQAPGQSTLHAPRESQSQSQSQTHSAPTFLPAGYGSVLNNPISDSGPAQQQQQQQQHSPLPPISQLGQAGGGGYIGRYDALLAATTTTDYHHHHHHHPLNPPPPFLLLRHHHQQALGRPATTLPAAPGTPAYRYSATKILVLLKHGQRAQLLALGGALIAPDTVALLNAEVEGARLRAVILWHEVHDGVPVGGDGEDMYDAGGLAFLEGLR